MHAWSSLRWSVRKYHTNLCFAIRKATSTGPTRQALAKLFFAIITSDRGRMELTVDSFKAIVIPTPVLDFLGRDTVSRSCITATQRLTLLDGVCVYLTILRWFVNRTMV